MVGGEMMINEVDCNSFFDQMDDLVEFPSDNDSGLFSDDLSAIWSNPPLPYEDIAQLEWLSTFVEDSFSGVGLTITEKNENIFLNKESSSEEFQTSSPISTGSSNFPPSPTPRGFRTKRPRPATFTPPSFPDSSKNKYVVPHIIKNKKKKIKRTIFPAPVEANNGNISTEENVRKCTHCEITKTPQWRAGPLGPKTLCNACGVRHKSGRLFPEYRPAASPTFVASLHSNSNRKVLEMRNKRDEKSPTIEALGIEK